MVSIFSRAALFKKNSHKDWGNEITSANLGPSGINYLKEHHAKKLAPVPDGTTSIHLLAFKVGGTVVNYVIRGKRNFLSESRPVVSPYAPPTSNKIK